MVELLHTLLANLAVIGLAAFTWTSALDRIERIDHTIRHLAFGTLVGLGCVALMNMPFRLGNGILLDLRSTLLALSGFFGGPIAAAASAAIAGAYRLSLGGEGLIAGMASIVIASAIGVLSRFLERARVNSLASVAFLGLWAAASHVLCFLLLPTSTIGLAFNSAALPLGVLVFASTVITGMALIQDSWRRVADQLTTVA